MKISKEIVSTSFSFHWEYKCVRFVHTQAQMRSEFQSNLSLSWQPVETDKYENLKQLQMMEWEVLKREYGLVYIIY